MSTEYTYPNIPEFVTDHLGNKVYPGDFIVYAVRSGNTGEMCSGIVQNFQFPQQQQYSFNKHVLKIKVKNPLTEKNSVIEESHKRFAKAVLPEQSANSDA